VRSGPSSAESWSPRDAVQVVPGAKLREICQLTRVMGWRPKQPRSLPERAPRCHHQAPARIIRGLHTNERGDLCALQCCQPRCCHSA
jgi:hypothetical protein